MVTANRGLVRCFPVLCFEPQRVLGQNDVLPQFTRVPQIMQFFSCFAARVCEFFVCVGTLARCFVQGHIADQAMSKTRSPATIRRDQARLERMLVERWNEAEVRELQERASIAEERNGGLEAEVNDLEDQARRFVSLVVL